jgi:hypothetical protein
MGVKSVGVLRTTEALTNLPPAERVLVELDSTRERGELLNNRLNRLEPRDVI